MTALGKLDSWAKKNLRSSWHRLFALVVGRKVLWSFDIISDKLSTGMAGLVLLGPCCLFWSDWCELEIAQCNTSLPAFAQCCLGAADLLKEQCLDKMAVFSCHWMSMLGDLYGALPGKEKNSTQHKMLEASKILNYFSFIDSYAANIREELTWGGGGKHTQDLNFRTTFWTSKNIGIN